jgi:diaminopimelate epimerase
MVIDFTKMSGAGNDFIFLGPRYARLKRQAPQLAVDLCSRRTSVGADGLVIVETAESGVFMHYYNSDGSKALFCGNGARCLVLYCLEKGIAKGSVDFDCGSGRCAGRAVENGIRVSMPPPALVGEIVIEAGEVRYEVSLVDSGVPHAVIVVDDIGSVDVEQIGRGIRHDRAFGKAGANVDFVMPAASGVHAIRTYERGVERETLACGSGCVAGALVLRDKRKVANPVRFKVASGDILEVDLSVGSRQVEADLTGPARTVYEGRIDLKEFADV